MCFWRELAPRVTVPSVVCPFLIPTFLHPSRQKFSNDRCGGGGRCVIQAITLSSCQEEKNGRDLMRVAPGGFDRRLITAGLCFFFGGGAGRGCTKGRCGGGGGFNFSVGLLRN